MDYGGKLVLRTVAPLVLYALMFIGAKLFTKCKKPWQANSLIDGIFFIAFLIYPSTASKLFSVFICHPLEDGAKYMRVDFTIQYVGSS